MASPLSEDVVQRIVADVLGKISPKNCATPTSGRTPPTPPREWKKPATPVTPPPAKSGGQKGVFDDASEAASAAGAAYEQLRKAGIAGRQKIVDVVKDLCTKNAQVWGKLEYDETQIGRLDHKIQKLQGIKNVPGTEWLSPLGMSGDFGISMEEHTPFGVIGAITPVTHSIPTISCNIVNMVAAGNTLVINPHPNGAQCAAVAVAAFNEAIEAATGIANVATIVRKPTLETFDAICKSEHVRLLCVTGGPMVVNAAMKSGKRAIAAGPGNPPVVVDVSANPDKAARDIILGGSYDNNLLCIGEKQVFVVESAYSAFMAAMKRAGAAKLNNLQLDRLTKEAFTFKEGQGGGCSHAAVNRELVGADPLLLAQRAGLSVPAETPLLFAETDLNHVFVMEEQMMPMVPIIKVKDIDEAIKQAKISEHGYKHSAMIHTLNVEHMTAMAQALDCTLFVKNGPCLAGLGSGGEGYASFSIATTTGEGITTPTTFTRTRRCVMVNNLNMY